MTETKIKELEKRIGYEFHDMQMLMTAMCHSSYANEHRQRQIHDNERLEFLGDSILGFVVADFLYRTRPDLQEGELTRMRADAVCETNLARVARSLNVSEHMLLGHGGEHDGSRQRSSILCDMMEAIIAAVYLDGGFDAAKQLIERRILCDISRTAHPAEDYKTHLQELVQREKDQRIQYRLIGESGPDHDKHFSTEVLLNGEVVGCGEGSSKKRAEQMAAKVAIERLFPANK